MLGVEEARSPPFTKVYPRGWERVRELNALPNGRIAVQLFTWLVEHCDERNALVVSVETLSEVLEVHRSTVMRGISVLVARQAVAVVKIGSANCYVLNPAETWRSAEEHKVFCSFGAKAIVGFRDNPGLKAKVAHYRSQGRLPLKGGA